MANIHYDNRSLERQGSTTVRTVQQKYESLTFDGWCSCSLEDEAASPGMWLEEEKLELDSDWLRLSWSFSSSASRSEGDLSRREREPEDLRMELG